MSHPLLTIRQLHKRFGDHHVLKGIDLTVNAGDRLAIIGGSGSGKSTLLRCLNFMELPSSGEITLDGRLIGKARPPAANGEKIVQYSEAELCEVRKKIGMVFQQFNLFPQMTVLQNVMEGLVQVKRLPKAQAQQIALAELASVGLADKAQAYPGRLSGGQQQRVAIARALAMQPEIMLFDEPTSSLDPERVGEVLDSIHRLAGEGRTLLLVTHELGFAYHFASRVIFLADGEFYESGTPDEVLKHPQRPKTRAFIERFTTFNF